MILFRVFESFKAPELAAITSKILYCNLLRMEIERIPYTVYRIPYTVYRIPSTVYRIPYTVYRIPNTVYRIPYWAGAVLQSPGGGCQFLSIFLNSKLKMFEIIQCLLGKIRKLSAQSI